ncbi:MAG: hypothetical protein QME96_01810 [Myxococcota bacterium]|nr:hypothetical protein [Myxococcota bacterium]
MDPLLELGTQILPPGDPRGQVGGIHGSDYTRASSAATTEAQVHLRLPRRKRRLRGVAKDRSRGTAFEKHATGPVGYLVAIGALY